MAEFAVRDVLVSIRLDRVRLGYVSPYGWETFALDRIPPRMIRDRGDARAVRRVKCTYARDDGTPVVVLALHVRELP